MKKCIECKTEVVYYHRSMFCKDCIKDFFEGEDEKQNELSKIICNTKDT